jgi:predicted TIM-barrel fold metal-dependent hydrolase
LSVAYSDAPNARVSVAPAFPGARLRHRHRARRSPRAGFIEFPFDTTRAIVNLLYTGSFARYPRLRFIFSHGGGAVPMLNARIKAPGTQPELAARIPHGVDYELRRHYYDTVTVTNAPAIAALSRLIPSSQILFGTDYPLGPPMRAGILGGNAAALLRRFRGSAGH